MAEEYIRLHKFDMDEKKLEVLVSSFTDRIEALEWINKTVSTEMRRSGLMSFIYWIETKQTELEGNKEEPKDLVKWYWHSYLHESRSPYIPSRLVFDAKYSRNQALERLNIYNMNNIKSYIKRLHSYTVLYWIE